MPLWGTWGRLLLPLILLTCSLWGYGPYLLCTPRLYPTPLPLSRAGSWHPALGYLLAPSSGSGCRSALLLEAPAYLKCSTGSFHLPPSQPQLSPFPGSCPHLLRGLPALELSSFSFWFFLPLSVRCFGALLEAEWSGSFSFFQSVIYSLSPFAITQQYGCPMIYFYEIETRKLNEILGMKSTLFTILNILGTSLTV